MTYLVNMQNNEITEVECIIDGIDILADMMGGMGVPRDDQGFLLPDADQIRWWIRWAEREERIDAAYDEADDEQKRQYEAAIIHEGHDLELLQDIQERILGIA